MAVTITELAGRPGTVDDKFVRTYTKTWQAVTTDSDDGPKTVIAAVRASIPSYYVSGNDTDLGAFIKSISATEKDAANDHFTWVVTASYSSAMEESDTEEDPLNRRWEKGYSSEQYQRVAARDIDENPIQNSALEDFVTPVEIEDSRPQLVIKRNEKHFDVNLAVEYQDAVNSDSFFGADPGTAKIKSIAANEKVENLTTGPFVFYEVTYTIQFKREGWKLNVLDQGLTKLVDDGSGGLVKEKIKDKNGQPVTKPVLLDGEGGELGDGDDPVFIEYSVYKEKPFKRLNLIRTS